MKTTFWTFAIIIVMGIMVLAFGCDLLISSRTKDVENMAQTVHNEATVIPVAPQGNCYATITTCS